ncbi:MAG: hypothetical protein FWH41_04050 [Treponema sp.]|nr:hypothetical protein [Treponema sp.]
MANKKQRYVVNKGVSFIGNGKHYKENDEIDESAFGKKEHFNKFVSDGKIIPVPPGKENSTVGVESTSLEDLQSIEKLTGKENSTVSVESVESVKTSGNTSITDRQSIEKLILEKGLLNKDKIKKYSDENLLRFAVENGVVEK